MNGEVFAVSRVAERKAYRNLRPKAPFHNAIGFGVSAGEMTV